MHSQPIPLEDELALSFLGRFAQLNGLPSIGDALESIKVHMPPAKRHPCIWHLAEICSLNQAEFSNKHSMLPVMYPISRYGESTKEVSSRRQHALSAGLKTPENGIRWCPECHSQDMKMRGFAHWRRRHQLNGIRWCIDHKVSLINTEAESILVKPVNFPVPGPALLSACDLEVELRNPTLGRLQRIFLAWLQRPEPYRQQAWAAVASARCRDLGLRTGEIGRREVTTDLIREKFPLSWLHRHMPEVAAKPFGLFVRKVDGACIDKHIPYPALACAAILAVLFESSDEALLALESADKQLSGAHISENSCDLAVAAFLDGAGFKDACQKFNVGAATVEAAIRTRLLQKSPAPQLGL